MFDGFFDLFELVVYSIIAIIYAGFALYVLSFMATLGYYRARRHIVLEMAQHSRNLKDQENDG